MSKKDSKPQASLAERTRRVISLMQGSDVMVSDLMLMQVVERRLKNPDDPIHASFRPSPDEPKMPGIDRVFNRVRELQPHKPQEQRDLTREALLLIAGTLAADIDLVVLGVEAEQELADALADVDTDAFGRPLGERPDADEPKPESAG